LDGLVTDGNISCKPTALNSFSEASSDRICEDGANDTTRTTGPGQAHAVFSLVTASIFSQDEKRLFEKEMHAESVHCAKKLPLIAAW
jgi:hypothetical protein